MGRYYFFPLLDTLTFDQHMLFLSEMFNGFSYLALEWYSTLTVYLQFGCTCFKCVELHV